MKSGSPCHKCPHGLTDKHGIIKPEYAGQEYEKMPCATCKLIHNTSVSKDNDAANSYRSKVMLEGAEFIDSQHTGWHDEREDWTDNEKIQSLPESDQLECFADFLRMFITLDPGTQRVVSYYLMREPLRIAAEDLGISVQAVHEKLKAAHTNNPYLKKMKEKLTR
jgi:hypothetical protein